MNMTKLFNVQKRLDQEILDNHPIQKGENRLNKKVLALLVELGELVNELPEVFKFWSNKKNQREKALKEYVDCLHFILSIGLEIRINPEELEKEIRYSQTIGSLEDHFTFLFEKISRLTHAGTITYQYITAFNYLLGLGQRLEFTPEEIEEAYLEKNQENHKRQEAGY